MVDGKRLQPSGVALVDECLKTEPPVEGGSGGHGFRMVSDSPGVSFLDNCWGHFGGHSGGHFGIIFD